MVNKKLQQVILSRLENNESIDDLVNNEGFQKELKYLEDFGYIECSYKGTSKDSFYSGYQITSFGRDKLE